MILAFAGRTPGAVPRAPVRELRAVWITTVNGLDWPGTYDPVQQRKSLAEILDKLAAAHFNTVFFQVRCRADAVYRSRYEPWCQELTGTLGGDPGWDPLSFVIQEGHARGLEVHAWFNTFYAKSGKAPPERSTPLHVVLKHPEWVHLAEGEWWVDPGIPAARRYVVSVAMDIVRRYDIDGIHFDFLRYPDKPFPDEKTYRKYGGPMSKEDWRRENVNSFVRTFHDSASGFKPMLKIGSAPIGIYANTASFKGLQSYSDLYQDSRLWLKEGMQDYLVPQTYWPLGRKPGSPDFVETARDWAEHAYGREVYLGIGAYKKEVSDQIPQLIDASRSLGFHGNSFFRYRSIENALGAGGRYKTPAVVPPMRWKDSIPPNPPEELAVRGVNGGGFRLRWSPPERAADGDSASFYCVYRSAGSPVDLSNSDNLVAIVRNGSMQMTDTVSHPAAARYFYAVSAFDKGNNESVPAEGSALIPEVAEALESLAPSFRLGRHYPQEVSSVIFIPYELGERAPVSLTILDDNNRPVMDLVRAVEPPGRYVAACDCSKLKKGVYSYRLAAAGFTRQRSFRLD
jgi:uncharacterized lipoprotein YddW (UPF0748 family)